MAKSDVLTVSQIRAALHLVYECCELGADPIAWRQHLLHGVNRLVGAAVAFGGRVDWRELGPGSLTRDQVQQTCGDAGFPNAAEREVYLHWLDTGSPLDNPMSVAFLQQGSVKTVATREQLVTRKQWQEAPVIARIRDGARLDEAMCSIEQLAPGLMFLLAVQRPVGERGFSERERRQLELVHNEILHHLGTRLASFGEASVCDLPPRLQEVLLCLLEGRSEKQVAVELGLSPHTVHEHVKRLHRHFAVASRGELAARCYRYLPVLQRGLAADAKPALQSD